MLDSSLENFLEMALTAERYKLYVDIISYLESIEYVTIEDELLNLAFESIGGENEKQPKPESTICDEMHVHLVGVLESQLLMSGITIAEGTELKDMFDFAIGVLHISEHEDIASIIATASNVEGPIEQLGGILALVTSQPADHWVNMLDSVSSQLISRIRELSTQQVNGEYQEMEASAEYLQKLRIYSEFCAKKERKLLSFDLVGSVILGRNFETYINTGILSDLFDGLEMQTLALELYFMALMSSDAKNDPPAAIRATIEKYLNDTTRIVRLNNEVGLINGEFVKFYQTTSKGLSN